MESVAAEVPSLWPLEVANALLVGQQKKRATEDSLGLLGTRVLWVEDFKKIDVELGRVYDARGDWEAVRGV